MSQVSHAGITDRPDRADQAETPLPASARRGAPRFARSTSGSRGSSGSTGLRSSAARLTLFSTLIRLIMPPEVRLAPQEAAGIRGTSLFLGPSAGRPLQPLQELLFVDGLDPEL